MTAIKKSYPVQFEEMRLIWINGIDISAYSHSETVKLVKGIKNIIYLGCKHNDTCSINDILIQIND